MIGIVISKQINRVLKTLKTDDWNATEKRKDAKAA